jgi:hypothetical protein
MLFRTPYLYHKKVCGLLALILRALGMFSVSQLMLSIPAMTTNNEGAEDRIFEHQACTQNTWTRETSI